MHEIRTDAEDSHTPTYAGRSFDQPVPKFELPAEGLSARSAYQLVHDELNLDGNPVLNLASFVTSWMEPEADDLARETMAKNLIDQDEYPQTEQIHERVVTMIGRLFNAPPDLSPVGTATVGSSEAIMLALLAHKRSWQRRREDAGLSTEKPNLVMGADTHTCWEKFTRYFDVEPRIAPMRPDDFTLSAGDVAERVDEHTIAVGALLGTTFTGQMDDLSGINALLADIERDRGWVVPLHIDAASGGFVVPFVKPELEWDFRLSQVRSINVSNHKYGLVYPGMGTVVFREKSDLPEELVFHINYLGGDMPNYSLNFSRPSNSVVLQYFNLLRLGRSGYERIMANVIENAQELERRLTEPGHFVGLGDTSTFPIVVVRAADPDALDLFAVSERLRERGWIVPAYSLPANAEHITVMRMVVKENFSRDMVDAFSSDLDSAVQKVLSADGTAEANRGKARQPVC